MKDLALDPETGDLLIEGGDLQPISGLEAVGQDLNITLRTWLGEWFLNTDVGLDFLGRIFGKGRDSVLRDSEIRRAILGVEGVAEIVEFNTTLNRSTRRLAVAYRVRTDLGEEIQNEFDLMATPSIPIIEPEPEPDGGEELAGFTDEYLETAVAYPYPMASSALGEEIGAIDSPPDVGAGGEPLVDLQPNTAIESSGGVVTGWESVVGLGLASIVGSPTLSAGNGILFNGSTQYATLDGNTDNFRALTEHGVGSLGVRLKMNNIGAPQQSILQTKSTGRGIFLGTDGGTALRFRAFNSANVVIWELEVDLSVAGYSSGDELDAVILTDGTTAELYLDGVLATDVGVSKEAGPHQYAGHLGRFTSVSSGYFDGAVNALFYSEQTLALATVRTAMGL